MGGGGGDIEIASAYHCPLRSSLPITLKLMRNRFNNRKRAGRGRREGDEGGEDRRRGEARGDAERAGSGEGRGRGGGHVVQRQYMRGKGAGSSQHIRAKVAKLQKV